MLPADLPPLRLQLDLDPLLRQNLGAAVTAHIRLLRRNGVTPHPELAALADVLLPPPPPPPEDPAVRARRLHAERSKRWRERQRHEIRQLAS